MSIDVKAIRDSYGMTQEDFAHFVGVSFQTVNKWENGHSKPSKLATEKLKKLERK